MSIRDTLIRLLGGVPATQRQTAPPPEPKLGEPQRNPLNIADGDTAEFPAVSAATRERQWTLPTPPPNVIPKGEKLAMDSAVSPTLNWALSGTFAEGLEFMGYPYLAELTQRAEYRRPAEIIAKAMTRKWIKFVAKGDDDKGDLLKQLQEAFEKYKVQDRFRQLAEQDGYFGRSQLYIDLGTTDDPEELKLPLTYTKSKIGKGRLQRLTVVEPMWSYPNRYNSTDPLKPDFFVPESWFVLGKEIHKSRLLTFVSRPVPDILKPVYAFGGMSLSQMAKPYVDNWLRIRQSVSDLVRNFSIIALKTNMASVLTGGGAQQLSKRAHLFNRARDNRGLMLLDKEMEELMNIAVPLGGLDALQAQAQEHMATVYGTPLIILFAITPTGLNASSEGEMEVFQDWTLSQQESLFTKNLTSVMHVIMLSEWGAIDEGITFQFEALEVQDIKELAEVRKAEADTAAVYIEAGVLEPAEERKRLSQAEDSLYPGLDLSVEIVPPDQEQEPSMEELMGGGTQPGAPHPVHQEQEPDYPRLQPAKMGQMPANGAK